MVAIDYEIKVAGLVPEFALIEIESMHVVPRPPGSPAETVLRGPVVDQSALHGLLQKVRDVGVPLISVTRLPPDQPSTRS